MNNHSRPRSPQPGPACESFAPLLALAGQERLNGRDANDLHNHLATCAYCQQELETYDWLDDALARHFGPAQRGPLSLADIRALTSRDYQPRTPPPEPLAPSESQGAQRSSRSERSFRQEPPRRPARPQRGRRVISILSAVAAVLIIAAISLALFASHSNQPGKPINPTSTPENVYIPQQQDALNGISMLSASDGWAVGGASVSDGGTEALILHYNGSHWDRVSGPSNQDLHVSMAMLTQISMVSADEGWAIGNAETIPGTSIAFILRYTGGRWILQTTLPTHSALAGIAMTSATDGWAVGALDVDSGPGSSTSLLLHYNGQNWVQVQAPGGGLSSVTMTSASNGWIIGAPAGGIGEASLLLHYDGSQWTQVATPSAFDQLFALSFVSPNDGWAVGIKHLAGSNGAMARYSGRPSEVVFAHYNGSAWGAAQVPLTYAANQFLSVSSLFMDSSSDGWAVGTFTQGNLYLHYTGGKWTQVQGPGSNGLNNVFMLSSGEGWAVGNNGTILHYMNGTWNMPTGAPLPTPTLPASNGTPQPTACPSPPAPPVGPPGTIVTPVPFNSWNTYTNTTYHFSLKYPANWSADGVTCTYGNGSFMLYNYNPNLWNGPGFPSGGIKVELDIRDNSTGMTALQFWQAEQQSDQQSVGGPACTSFTTQQLTIAGRSAVEGGCPAQRWDEFYIPDGSVMLSITESTAPDGDTSYTILKQIVSSLTFTS